MLLSRSFIATPIGIVLLLGLIACAVDTRRSPTPTSSEPAAPWAEAWKQAEGLHEKGNFTAAIRNYDEALRLLPTGAQYQAIRADINISISDAYIMLEDGLSAFAAANDADRLLDQATRYEKQGTAWKWMAGQGMILVAASTMYVKPSLAEQELVQTKQLLVRVKDSANLPEIHYFLGVVNLRLGLRQEAFEELRTYLASHDSLVTSKSRATMRERARQWLKEAAK